MARVLEGIREVAGKDESFIEAMEAGVFEKPPLSTYNKWLAWRKASATRPSASTGEADVTTSRQEGELWRHVMSHLYGDAWRIQLAAQEEEAAIAAADEADEGEEVEGDTRGSLAVVLSSAPAGSAGPAGSGGEVPASSATPRVRDLLGGSEGSSGVATPVGLRKVLETEPDPDKEDLESWRSKIMRTVSALERAGHPPKDEDLERCIRKGNYAFKMQGFDMSKQVSYLKSTFGEVLLGEGEYSDTEYNGRLSALMEMLRARGTAVSEHAGRLFSGPTTSRLASVEVSPEKKGKEAERISLTPPKENPSAEVEQLKEEMVRLKRRLDTKFSPAGLPGDGTPAQDALAQAIAVQTQTLQAALKTKNSDGRHSVVKVNPTFKWPRLGDDGPDSRDVE